MTTHDDLIEAMAREMCAALGLEPDEILPRGERDASDYFARWKAYAPTARAALAVARPAILEEAAKVADSYMDDAVESEAHMKCRGIAMDIRAIKHLSPPPQAGSDSARSCDRDEPGSTGSPPESR